GALVLRGARRVAVLAAQARRNLDQLQWQPVREALFVLGVAFRDPVRGALADGDQAGLHGNRARCAPAGMQAGLAGTTTPLRIARRRRLRAAARRRPSTGARARRTRARAAA